MPAVGDQGEQGSCVGWAVGSAARSYYVGAVDGQHVGQDTNLVGPAFVYDSIRDRNAGSSIPNALDLLTSGAVSLAEYPYDDPLCRLPSPGRRPDSA